VRAGRFSLGGGDCDEKAYAFFIRQVNWVSRNVSRTRLNRARGISGTRKMRIDCKPRLVRRKCVTTVQQKAGREYLGVPWRTGP